MAAGRSGSGNFARGALGGARRRRGFVMFVKPLPRYVIDKRLASGLTGFYWNIPTYYRKLGCGIPNERLGTNYETACGEDGTGGRAAALNELFNEWDQKRLGEVV